MLNVVANNEKKKEHIWDFSRQARIINKNKIK